MSEQLSKTSGLKYVAIFVLLVTFYWLTRPINHSESYDCYTYALFAENYELGSAPDSRNILFQVVNRLVYLGGQMSGLNIGTLELLVAVSIIAGALSLILFARLMQNGFGVSSFAAWSGAGFLGFTYGFWRYTGEAEIYIPSIFLILCTLTLLIGYLSNPSKNRLRLIAAAVSAGLAVLYYQPNVIALFIAAPILFLKPLRIVDGAIYIMAGSLVIGVGVFTSFVALNETYPSISELMNYSNSRFEEFNDPPTFNTAIKKLTLASGHDVLCAHWTRTIDTVRNFLNPYIPGCVYNFNVVNYAGKGIQHLTAIAAILFVPILILFIRIHWIASKGWNIARPSNRTLFLVAWLSLMTLIVAAVDPGSFEGWIPVLLPVAILLTLFVFEPCCKLGRKKTLIAFLLLMMSYNFFGGMLIWRNQSGDYFYHKTAWIRSELTAEDTVLFNEHDYRILDYLIYHSDVRVAFITGPDQVTLGRNTPDIYSLPPEEFLNSFACHQRLFVLDDVLEPDPAIKNCRYGCAKMKSALLLAERLKGKTCKVNQGVFGSTFRVKPQKKIRIDSMVAPTTSTQ